MCMLQLRHRVLTKYVAREPSNLGRGVVQVGEISKGYVRYLAYMGLLVGVEQGKNKKL